MISESTKIPLTVKEGSVSLPLPAIILLVIAAALGGYCYQKKKKQ